VIPARHWPLFARAFAWYAERLLRGHFRALHVRGSLPPVNEPLLVVAQHVGWWDPLVFFHLSRVRFVGKHYVMMEEANLRQFPFFGWLGAFSLDRRARGAALPSVRYALARLREPGARVWIFPQGALQPADFRPLRCEPGAGWLAARTETLAVPVALRYEFLESQRPEIFVSFGTPRTVLPVGHPAGVDPVADMLTAEADRLRDDVYRAQLDGFDRILEGRRSVSDLFAGIRRVVGNRQ
jgi:1-acyl-sn-glycerol-3-phosphate acyltransferase